MRDLDIYFDGVPADLKIQSSPQRKGASAGQGNKTDRGAMPTGPPDGRRGSDAQEPLNRRGSRPDGMAVEIG